MSDLDKAFKRLNFFRGFLTTEEDWNDGVAYHVAKHRLHNRLFHGFGVVPGFDGELRVNARGKGELSVEVLPGMCVDGDGHEILITEPEIRAINPIDYKLPQTVYVVARHYEEMADFIAYKENLEYKGHRRIAEVARIEVQVVEPEAGDGVELARVALEPGVKRITDARDPLNPKANEIDLRYVPVAGVVGTRIPMVFVQRLMLLVKDMVDIHGHLRHKHAVSTAGDVLHSLLSLQMFFRSRLVDMWNLFPIWGDLLAVQWIFTEQVEAQHPEIGSRKEFASYKRHIELLRDFSREGRSDVDFLQTLISYETKAMENLRAIFFEREAQVKADKGPATPLEKIAEVLKVHSGGFDDKLEVEGVTLVRADEINVLDSKSEKAHDFRISDYRDRYRSRQKLKYPDGSVVEDVGVAYEGGSCEFTVRNVVPGRPLLLLVRMDYVYGDWEAEMKVNGKKVGVMRCPGQDRKFRWRNWPFIVDADFVGDVELKFSQTPLTQDRDINFFRIWAYQPAE